MTSAAARQRTKNGRRSRSPALIDADELDEQPPATQPPHVEPARVLFPVAAKASPQAAARSAAAPVVKVPAPKAPRHGFAVSLLEPWDPLKDRMKSAVIQQIIAKLDKEAFKDMNQCVLDDIVLASFLVKAELKGARQYAGRSIHTIGYVPHPVKDTQNDRSHGHYLCFWYDKTELKWYNSLPEWEPSAVMAMVDLVMAFVKAINPGVNIKLASHTMELQTGDECGFIALNQICRNIESTYSVTRRTVVVVVK